MMFMIMLRLLFCYIHFSSEKSLCVSSDESFAPQAHIHDRPALRDVSNITAASATPLLPTPADTSDSNILLMSASDDSSTIPHSEILTTTTNNTSSSNTRIPSEPSTSSVISTPLCSSTPYKPPRVTRKRQRKPENWQCNVNQINRSHGKQYKSKDGTHRPAKTLRRIQCNCKFNCSRNVDVHQQQSAFDRYWSLPNTEKQYYFAQCINKSAPNKRQRPDYKGKKNVSMEFQLIVGSDDCTTIRVCKEFFMGTFDISNSQIKTHCKNMDHSGTLKPKVRKTPATKIPDEKIEDIINHINSFPRIESHYCRSTTQRLYLDPALSIRKMYALYREKCTSTGKTAVKLWKYEQVFSTKFNLGFHAPRKDICDKCKQYQASNAAGGLSAEEQEAKDLHGKSREEVRAERHRDTANPDTGTLVVSFDMENVFALPRTSVSSAFYRRKFNTYNLTARVNRTTKGYCAIWNEKMSSRSGNDIASGINALLPEIIKDHPDTRHLILWSDSCVPQNRNQMMSFCLQNFLQQTRSLESITQKFCEPGHSSIQDIDNLHSIIERSLKGLEIWSPISLVRHMKQLRPNNLEMCVKLLTERSFLDFGAQSGLGTYKNVKYASVKELHYTSANKFTIYTKASLDPAAEVNTITVWKMVCLRNGTPRPLPQPKLAKKSGGLSEEKIKDLKSMLIYMNGDDRVYMEAALR